MRLVYLTSLRRPLAWIGLILILVSTALAVFIWPIQRQATLVGQRIGQVQESLKAELNQRLQSHHAEQVIDFAQRLPVIAPTTEVIQEIQRSSVANGVVFAGFDVSNRAATIQTLGKTDLSFRLQGSYGNIKRVLKDVLGRYPLAVLVNMQMQRLSSPTDLQAQIELTLLARALPPADITGSPPN